MKEKIEIVRPAQTVGQNHIPEQRIDADDKDGAVAFAAQLNRDNPGLVHEVRVTIIP